MVKTQTVKKIVKITASVLVYLFLAICIFGVVLTIMSKKGDDAATMFGMQMRVVLSSSMEKCDETDVSEFKIKDIPVGSMVFIETVPEDPEKAAEWYSDIKIGDVLTFKYVYVSQETITHRVTGIRTEADGSYTIRLDGDNKSSDAETLTQIINTGEENSPNYIIGKVTGQSYFVGLMARTLRSPVGLIFIVIIPSVVIMFLEILRVIKVLTEDKRREQNERLEKQESELDELRRKLAALEGEKAESSSASEANGAGEE